MSDSYFDDKNNAGVRTKETPVFDPDTREIESYQLLQNVKMKDQSGEVHRELYNLTIYSPENVGVIGSDGETRIDKQIAETWFREGITFEGRDRTMAVLRINEEGAPSLLVDKEKSGLYGQEKQSVDGFIVVG